MKKILAGLAILLLAIITITGSFACKKPKNCRTFCYDYSGTKLRGMIDGDLLRTLSEDYANDPSKKFIGGVEGNRDALSMTFDLEKLKTLIWQMDSSACAKNCNSKVVLGIRFYYIKYPSTLGTLDEPPALHGISPEERNKHALVMVPAYWDEENKVWRDFNIWSRNATCFQPFTSADSLVGVGAFFKLNEDPNSGDNHGGVGPPPDPGTFENNP